MNTEKIFIRAISPRNIHDEPSDESMAVLRELDGLRLAGRLNVRRFTGAINSIHCANPGESLPVQGDWSTGSKFPALMNSVELAVEQARLEALQKNGVLSDGTDETGDTVGRLNAIKRVIARRAKQP